LISKFAGELIKVFPPPPEDVADIVNVVFTGTALVVVVRVKVPLLVWLPVTALNEAGENDADTRMAKPKCSWL
jgi:hypothetical protein